MYTTAGRRKYVLANRSTAGGMVAVNMTVCGKQNKIIFGSASVAIYVQVNLRNQE